MGRLLSWLFLTALPLMPQLISAIATRVAIAIGFGTASYVGLSSVFDSVLSELSSITSLLPPQVISMIGLIGIPDGINIMLSAGSALLVFKGMNAAGQMRRSVWRKPGSTDPMNWEA